MKIPVLLTYIVHHTIELFEIQAKYVLAELSVLNLNSKKQGIKYLAFVYFM